MKLRQKIAIWIKTKILHKEPLWIKKKLIIVYYTRTDGEAEIVIPEVKFKAVKKQDFYIDELTISHN